MRMEFKNQEPFRDYNLKEDKDPDDITFTVRVTKKDKQWFKDAKIQIRQPKNSTALKQLAEIGALIVLHDKKTSGILDVVRENFRRNKRIGVSESEYDIKKN